MRRGVQEVPLFCHHHVLLKQRQRDAAARRQSGGSSFSPLVAVGDFHAGDHHHPTLAQE